jgi:hypothetical protein
LATSAELVFFANVLDVVLNTASLEDVDLRVTHESIGSSVQSHVALLTGFNVHRYHFAVTDFNPFNWRMTFVTDVHFIFFLGLNQSLS